MGIWTPYLLNESSKLPKESKSQEKRVTRSTGDIWFFSRAFLKYFKLFYYDESQERTKLSLRNIIKQKKLW